jgi:hypothetical protein
VNKDYEMCAVLIESEKREELKAAKTAEEVLDIAFRAGHNHWMYLDEQTQFKGAIGAALIVLKEGPEFERVQRSVTALGKLSAIMNALQQGVPIDLEAMLKEKEAEPDQTPVIPLSKLWNDIRYASDRGAKHG